MNAGWFESFGRSILVLLQPVGLVWCAVLALALALAWKRHWRFATAAAGIAAFLQLIGGTPFSEWLLDSLERPYAGVKFAELPACDAIVQLGGAVDVVPREVGHIHLTFAGDRLVMALELARLGKAPVLCLGGGFAPPGSPHGHEADVVKAAIVERGLTGVEVVSLGGSFDTHHEAVHARALARERGWRRILLVTSAAHMRRAAATFRHAGLEVVPAPCNFLTTPDAPLRPRTLRLPAWPGFFRTSVWLHETVGWYEYRRRGWLTAADAHEP